MTQWGEELPIYRQLYQQVVDQICDGCLSEGEVLPSVRSLAAELKINHLTVMKSYQLLVDEGVIEKRRGQGMFVMAGAIETLRQQQKQKFFHQELPKLAQQLQRLGISPDELMAHLQQLNEEQ